MEHPKLIETQTGQYLLQTLKRCHDFRVNRYSLFFNAVIFVSFISVVTIILFLCRKQKKTPEEKQNQSIRDQKYILEKIRGLQYQRDMHLAGQVVSQKITDIPTTTFSSPYDLIKKEN